MSYQSKPQADGRYRIKSHFSRKYMEYVPNDRPPPWVRLNDRDADSSNQIWIITSCGKGKYTIASAYDGKYLGIRKKAEFYQGHGYPVGHTNARQWKIKQNSDHAYSRISLSGDSDVLDAQEKMGDKVVHFYSKEDALDTQCWVFEPVRDAPKQSPKPPSVPSPPPGIPSPALGIPSPPPSVSPLPPDVPSQPPSTPSPPPSTPSEPPSTPSQPTTPLPKPPTTPPKSTITPPIILTDPPPKPSAGGRTFENTFFNFTVEEAALYEFDIIVIGTGIGGGIIAGDLFDTNSMLGRNAKHILVIERGGLAFHSHCLNASRPNGLGEDHGQQNDTFFAKFKEDYALSPDTQTSDLKAGPMFNLGGRSAAWGLFAPRIHDETFRAYFDPQVHVDLVGQYYRMAEELMTLSLPKTRPVHQALMERLNMTTEDMVKAIKSVDWEWGRIASEFCDEKNFAFARGAYSTIDKLLEIAMSKPKAPDGQEMEHVNFKQLLGVEVRRVVWDLTNPKQATGVYVRSPDGKEETIRLRAGGNVVVCAGSVMSAAILLRSHVPLEANGGLHVTDHDIFYKDLAFQYRSLADKQVVGSMKLQTFVRMGGGEIVLANMSVDASSFLPRDIVPLDALQKFIIAFIRKAELNMNNTVKLINDEPVVTLNRGPNSNFTTSDPTIAALRQLTETSLDTMHAVLQADFFPDARPGGEYFKALEVGGVAHELGTIPMKGPKNTSAYCLDTDLKLRGYEGVYVCDLSVFPVSPEVNPTITLAALALRISRRTLHPRSIIITRDGQVHTEDSGTLDADCAYVVNHRGRAVKVWISNRAGVDISSEENGVALGPGDLVKYKRTPGVTESVSVFDLQYLSRNEFLPEPELLPAQPGRITEIL
ncbi:FAD/NAD(P)-binding domain-containing protein [Obba rivulosa]|uniref:FAD/NAD(P)-binding domain-containing protein n=1 Tax=Obba rivulosa TaxID=1052685 RepID=A0A8E2AZF6_9APHY|nr:FAD/NAD(P)-binding domain-containing protein [Obba rivulosa]